MSGESAFRPAAVILAGGRSSRLAPGPKALAPLAGKPMVSWVIDRLREQAGPLWLSVQQRGTALDDLGLSTVPDIVQRHRGPLTGLCSALVRLAGEGVAEWLLMCPCDAPFVPRDLASPLHEAAVREAAPVATIRYESVVQPTFSLWHLSLLDPVREAVMNEGRGGLMSMLDRLPHAVLDWPASAVSPFFNINTPEDLAEAGRLLDAGDAPD